MTDGDEIERLKAERDSALGRAADAERKAAAEEARWRLMVQQAREARDKADAMLERYLAALNAIKEELERMFSKAYLSEAGDGHLARFIYRRIAEVLFDRPAEESKGR